MVCGPHIAALLGKNGKPVCRPDKLCDFVLKYPNLHFTVLQPGFGSGHPPFTRSEESLLYAILSVYLFLQHDFKYHFPLQLANEKQ